MKYRLEGRNKLISTKNKLNSILLLTSFLSVFIFIEIGLRLFEDPYPIKKIGSYKSEIIDQKGAYPPKNTILHSKAFFKNKKYYDVVYTFDENRRRKTHAHSKLSSKHIILAGCSMVFGEGLADENTLDYLLKKNFPDYNIYNYGVPAQAPNFFLTRLNEFPIDQEIQPIENGFLIYFLASFHLPRILGKLSHPSVMHGHYFDFSENNVIDKGKYIESQKLKSYLSLLLYKAGNYSRLISRINQLIFKLNNEIYDSDIDYLISILVEIKNKYATTNHRKFIVYFGQYEDEMMPDLRNRLIRKLKESTLDVVFSQTITQPLIQDYDGHLTALSNQDLVKEIFLFLKKMEN